MADKTVIITGGNRGLGLSCAQALAADREWQVVLAVRDMESGRRAAEKITMATGNEKVLVRQLDLASLAEVRAFAADFKADNHSPLRTVVCNAGISHRRLPIMSRRPPRFGRPVSNWPAAAGRDAIAAE